jgi:hypothetical protein
METPIAVPKNAQTTGSLIRSRIAILARIIVAMNAIALNSVEVRRRFDA